MSAERIKKIFEEKFGNSFRSFRAPGRINLIGEHTDYNLGFVTPAAIDRYIHVAIKPNCKDEYRLYADDLKEEIKINQETNFNKLPLWAKYPLGVVNEMRKSGYEIPGFDAVYGGNIPNGSGLSSSAAIEMAFAVAFNNLFDLGLDQYTIAKIGQLAEHNTAGVKCGIMDQFASLFGRRDKLIHLDCKDYSFKYVPFENDGVKLILLDTQVKHSLASSEYNKRIEECTEGVNLLSNLYPEVKSLRDADLEMIKHLEGDLNPVVKKRCEYVIEENQRVLDTITALEKGNMKKVGDLLYDSHYGLSSKYEVSCKELDYLVEKAKTIKGVYGARMMGGGFGGCTINLVKADNLDFFKNSVSKSYFETFNIYPKIYELKITDGAHET